MKDRPDDKARLLHIVDAIAEIESYTEDVDYVFFERDSKTRFASIKQLEIIGEAAYHLSRETKEKHAAVQWKSIKLSKTSSISYCAFFTATFIYSVVWQISFNLLIP